MTRPGQKHLPQLDKKGYRVSVYGKTVCRSRQVPTHTYSWNDGYRGENLASGTKTYEERPGKGRSTVTATSGQTKTQDDCSGLRRG
jgi:hypothetical protein